MINNIFNALKTSRIGMKSLLDRLSKKNISDNELEQLEEQLFLSDIGYDLVNKIIDIARTYPADGFKDKIRKELQSLLPKLNDVNIEKSPTINLIVGVNGSGKTTSAAKLSYFYKSLGYDVTLVAADTYRAAAVEQLKIWSEKAKTKLVYNKKTKDPASIVFDGLESADANKSDLVIIDTAGRIQTNKNLMQELDKINRIIDKRFSHFDLSSFITLDSTVGQNTISQAKEFNEYCNLDGAILTKLDGTAKGGVVFPLFNQLKIPVKFVGVGEKLTDFETFDPEAYINGLLG